MKRVLTYLCVGLLSIPFVSANEHLLVKERSDDRSYYQILKDMYEKSTAAELSDVLDKLSVGRCFVSEEPNNPIAAAYHVREKVLPPPVAEPDVGPIKKDPTERPTVYEVSAVWNRQEKASFYDEMDIEKFNTFYLGKIKYIELSIMGESLYFVFGNEKKHSDLKRHENYLVENVSDIEVDGTLKTSIMCYYFKQVP